MKDFLIISCTGQKDKIGLKLNNNFFIHNLQTKIHNNEVLVSTILNFINKHKANIDKNFSVLLIMALKFFNVKNIMWLKELEYRRKIYLDIKIQIYPNLP